MASQSYIIRQEDQIIALESAIADTTAALHLEQEQEQFLHGGLCAAVYPENRDCWKTLAVNARAVRRRLDELIALLDTVP